jgi:hypothetical protein
MAGNEDEGGVSSKDSGVAIKGRHVSRLLSLCKPLPSQPLLAQGCLWPIEAEQKDERREGEKRIEERKKQGRGNVRKIIQRRHIEQYVRKR